VLASHLCTSKGSLVQGTQKRVPKYEAKLATPSPEQYFSLGGSLCQKSARFAYPKMGTEMGSVFGSVLDSICDPGSESEFGPFF
jgi:hypothetical protein